MSRASVLRLLAGAALATLVPAASAAPLYSAHHVEQIPGRRACTPVGINASGRMLGFGVIDTTADSTAWVASRANRLFDTRPLDGGTLVGLDDRGSIVANRPVDGVPYTDEAFMSRPGSRDGHRIDSLGWAYSHANQVAADGRVAGSLSGAGSAVHAFVTGPDGRGTVDLHDAVPGGGRLALAVSTSGQVVVQSTLLLYASDPAQQAFTVVRVPGDTSLDNSPVAVGINGDGLIAGYTYRELGDAIIGWVVHADGTGLRVLEPLPDGDSDYIRALAINDAGYVVGAASAAYRGRTTIAAFVVRGPDAPMEDLNDLVAPGGHGYLTWAGAINDAGQILAASADGDCYRLDPIVAPAAPAAPR